MLINLNTIFYLAIPIILPIVLTDFTYIIPKIMLLITS